MLLLSRARVLYYRTERCRLRCPNNRNIGSLIHITPAETMRSNCRSRRRVDALFVVLSIIFCLLQLLAASTVRYYSRASKPVE